MLAAMSDVSAERAVTIDLDHLNEAQRAAVTHLHGPLLVIAGPGSGKTRVITHRIAWLIEQGTPPWRILAVTFTNRAAREMAERVESLRHSDDEGAVWLGTFHRICVRMLKAHGASIGIPQNFSIFDRADQLFVVRNALQELGFDNRSLMKPNAVLNRISRAKSENVSLPEFERLVKDYEDEIVARVWERYNSALLRDAALDFDDLLLQTLKMMRGQSEIRRIYEERFEHVLVDEFQDTSVVQYQLARAWSRGTRNLTVVGDPDQMIYTWRAADIRNLASYRRDFPDFSEIELNTNYRSTQQILDVANSVISRSPNRNSRRLETPNRDGAVPRVHEAYSETDEASYVCDVIEAGHSSGTQSLGHFAVLYRTNAQSRPFEEALIHRNIPYRLPGATRFYDRREIRDLIAYLRVLRNPHDAAAFARVVNVPKRGVGQRTIQALENWSETHAKSLFQAASAAAGIDLDLLGRAFAPPPVSKRSGQQLRRLITLLNDISSGAARVTLADTLLRVIESIGYQDWLVKTTDDESEFEARWQNVNELATVTDRYADTPPIEALDAFLFDVSLLMDDDDLSNEPADAVTLINLHQAKGLEFPVVFLTGLEEELLPHARSIDDPARLEEERRLCYVGMTRAMRELHLLHAFRRAYQGRSGHNPPSRFLADIPEGLLQRHQRQQARVGDDVRPARNRTVRWDDFDSFDAEPVAAPSVGLKEGDEVSHEIFGHGVVIALRTIGRDAEVTVRFADTGVKRLLASMANLTRA